MKKPLKITLISLGSIAAFVLLVVIIVSLFGGSIAKSYVNNNAEKIIGRQASVEHVGINLFSGRVKIHGLAVMEDNPAEQFAGFDTLDVAVSLLRLLGKTVYVRHLTLAGFDAQVEQNGSQFNFSSIIQHFAKDSTEVEEDDTTPSGWIISLHKIRLANSSARYADLQLGSHLGVKNLNIIVPDFTIGGSDETDAGITLDLADGGSLTANATYDATTKQFDTKLNLSNFSLNQVLPYAESSTNIKDIKGILGVEATAKGCMDHIMDMDISANAALDGVDVIGPTATSIASLKHLGVVLNRLVLSQKLYDIASVELNGLSAAYEMFDDGSNTISRLLKPKEADEVNKVDEVDGASQPQDSTTPSAPQLQLHVGHVALSDINLTYADHTLPVDFVFPVTNLRVEADNISLTGDNSARIFANLPHGGALITNWKGNIGNWKQHQNLKLIIKDLHLTDLSPYMLAYFGQPFTDGIFSFTSSNTIHNSQLNGKNHIDIFRPTLGDHRKDIQAKLHLPVKAALYILKDKDDKVILDVPVAGNVDSPEFNYMKLVWKTLGNLIVKVATSPARALGDLFNGDSDDLFIPIDPDEKGFTSEQFYQIDKLADIAQSDESLTLLFTLQHATPTTDADQRRNDILRHHLTELGLNDTQFSIVTTEPDDQIKRNGYLVTMGIEN